jgi:hypothetical protein
MSPSLGLAGRQSCLSVRNRGIYHPLSSHHCLPPSTLLPNQLTNQPTNNPNQPAFHPAPSASSPYGPIAPPLRSPIDNNSGPLPAAAPAREIANPYAYAAFAYDPSRS